MDQGQQGTIAADGACSDPWSFFDRVYCISLLNRPDRRQRVKRELAVVGLLARTEFVLVDQGGNDPVQSIYDSHIRCLRRGLAAGAEHILVLEDDVIFRRFDAGRLRQACSALADRGDWQVFFLGCLIDASQQTRDPALRAVRYRCLAHAYGVSRPFARLLCSQRWTGMPFDTLLTRYNTAYYALFPMCAFQGPSPSDNRPVVLDRLRRLLGGLVLIQRGNELYHCHRRLILALHVLVLAGILLFFGSTVV